MNVKDYSLDQIDYIIEIMEKQIKTSSMNNNEANEYRFGQAKTAKMAINLLKDFKKSLKKFGVEDNEDEIELPVEKTYPDELVIV